jgi:hypothetical protein
MTAVLTTLTSFDGTNEAYPFGGLIADANGDLFGTTAGGGANSVGTVFEIVNNGSPTAPSYASTPTTLVSFNVTDGYFPEAGLTADANGNLFGTTAFGGQYGDGTVFELVNTGSATAPSYASNSTPIYLVNFNDTDGSFPALANLIIDAKGDLFGTTQSGGQYGGGTVFELVNTGSVAVPSYASTPTTLVSFNGTDGADPLTGLLADANGNLFGTTEGGGQYGYGTVFEIVNTGSVAVPSYASNSTPISLVSFNGTDGYAPEVTSLIADAKGDLFGTTLFGGTNFGANGGFGTVFELVNTGSVAVPSYASTPTTLVSFNGTDGYGPAGTLIADANGNLFGTTSVNGGTVFEIVNNGSATAPSYASNSTPITLVSFNGTTNGDQPFGTLIADANGNLFGTTMGGGANSAGTMFEITGSGFVVAQPDHWTNTLGGNWATAGNWKPGVPTATLNADIDAPGVYSVAITTAAIAYGLLVNDAQATVTDNKGSLTLVGSGGTNGALNIKAGTFVLNGGALNAGTISIGTGGALQIAKGTYTLSETITDNGSLTDTTTATITGNISGTGTILAQNAANLTISGNLTGSESFSLTNTAHVLISTAVNGTDFMVANSAVLEFGTADFGNVTFASGSNGTVKFDAPLTPGSNTFTGTISGLTPKTKIDLADLSFTGTMSESYNNGVLTVGNGTNSVSLNVSTTVTNPTWMLSPDSTGGTVVVDPPAPSSPANSPPGLDHVVALFSQFAAGFSDQSQHGVLNTNPLSQIVTNQEQFLANPHHG